VTVRSTRRLPVVRAVLVGAAALVLLAGCGVGGTGDKGYIDGNGIIREFTGAQRATVDSLSGTSLEGQKLDLADYRGKVVVVNYWWSAYPPCKQEARTVVAAARHYRDKGVVFLGVDALDTKGAARSYMKRYGIDYPNVRDAVATQYPNWGVTGVPETFFVDRQGRAVEHVGRQIHTAGQIDEGIRKALE